VWNFHKGRLLSSIHSLPKVVIVWCPFLAGAEDGSINVWNFHSGRLLSSVDGGPSERAASQWGSGSGVEVTGLAVATSTDTNGQAAPCIVATGWDRKVRHHIM
jgi:hypothetical protein